MGAEHRRKGIKRKRFQKLPFEPEADEAAGWSKGHDGKGAPLGTMYNPESNIMSYGLECIGPASKCPISCCICRKTLVGANGLRKHLDSRHAEMGVTLRKATQTKEATRRKKLERQALTRHGPDARYVQCSKKGCKARFCTSLTGNGLRCKRHHVITSEEAAQRGAYMVPEGKRICRLMRSKLFTDKDGVAIRALAVVAPAWDGAMLPLNTSCAT